MNARGRRPAIGGPPMATRRDGARDRLSVSRARLDPMNLQQSYTVPATNALSGATFNARVAASPGAPRVQHVSIEQWDWGTVSPKVVVSFDPRDLASGPGEPFSFSVMAVGADAEGRRLQVEDGSDELMAFSDIDARYDLRGEGMISRWIDVADLEVRVTVDEAM
jgi:hypothetical protein